MPADQDNGSSGSWRQRFGRSTSREGARNGAAPAHAGERDDERRAIQETDGVPFAPDRPAEQQPSSQVDDASSQADGVQFEAPTLRAWSPAEVVATWQDEGPLVHEPTGIAKLDELTGGGPVYGSRWFWLGAPDAGKTAELVQIADTWARRGIVVGFLAVDEEPTDITTRLAQRAKYTRAECEARDPAVLQEMCEALKDLPIRLYGPTWTIEAAAVDLISFAKVSGQTGRVALFVDSIQQVTCAAMAAAEREVSPREIVSANVRALRSVATSHRLIAMATSEMNRNAYRSVEAVEQSNDMAAGKESGAIEFSARVMVSVRSVKGEKDLSVLRIVKNKHGASGDEIHRRIDRRRMVIEDAEAPAEAPASDARTQARRAGKVQAAARLADFLADHQGIGVRKLRAGLRATWGSWPTDLVDDAGAVLGGAFIAPEPMPGKPKTHYLDGSKLPPAVVQALALERRPTVLAARPNVEEKGGCDDEE